MAEEKNEFGNKVLEAAKKLLGLKYNAEGGNGEKDTDAGTFIYTVFKTAGADISSKKVDEQYLYAGRNGGTLFETVSAAVNGDIIFYKEETTENTAESCGVTNAAIYMETSKVIRVDTVAGVKEDDLEYKKDIKFIICRFANSTKLPDDIKTETIPKTADGKTNQKDTGFETKPAGKDHVHITKLPKGKTYCEPIYPDYVCIPDTVPEWALKNAISNINSGAASVINNSSSSETGSNNKEDEATEVAPNGLHYSESEIKALMEKNPNLTREKAIEMLSKESKYTTPVSDSSANSNSDKSATMPGDKEDENHSHGQAPNGKYYSNNDWNFLKNLSLTDVQIKAALDMNAAYAK